MEDKLDQGKLWVALSDLFVDAEVDTSKSVLSDSNMERQGEIISDYHLICVLGNPPRIWNASNVNKSPELLASTIQSFFENPADKAHLPS